MLGAMLRLRVMLPVAGAVGVLVLGCGSSDGGSSARATPTATEPAPAATATAAPEATATPAARRRRGVRLVRIGSFDAPVFVTAPPGDRRVQFVVEQDGRIMVVRNGRKRSTPFLDISSQVTSGGEQGLLSMAFAPDYASSGRFYVYFTDNSGDQRVVEYGRESADRADPASARLVVEMADSESNHNGGLLLFGPGGHLYIGTGDGGGGGDRHGARGNAQNLGSLLGKILRIDPLAAPGRPYSVPRSNPFAGRSGARGEIYAYGLRNPWRFSFDRRTGDLSIGDVGQGDVEEIDFVRSGRGKNFGWRPFEGRRRYTPGESAPGHVRPVIQRFHSDGNCSITGGVVVRDRSVPELYGRYVFGDYCRGRIETARLRPGRATQQRTTRLRVSSLSSFGEDARGRVYATSLDGPVYRLAARR
jgi:glucose/arabinose dehydrogenase